MKRSITGNISSHPGLRHTAIAEVLAGEILDGMHRDGPPPRGELAARFGVNMKTIDKSLATLESRQLIVRSCSKRYG